MSTLIIGFLIGCAFGSILYLGGATSYRRILGTLRLKDLTVLKLICTAIGIGTLGIYMLDLGGLANMSIKPTYVWGVGLGGILFGIGWAVSGYCPGTCVVGSSEGKKDAMATVFGGLVGALLFAMVFPFIEPTLIQKANFGSITLGGVLGVSGIYLAIGLSVVLLGAVFFVLKDSYE
ncbi:MAG: YeeE/YedE family protein [Porticoccaceae bacterium]|nr:YeeE/YedE family protein [Porticoccaceae bacterium]